MESVRQRPKTEVVDATLVLMISDEETEDSRVYGRQGTTATSEEHRLPARTDKRRHDGTARKKEKKFKIDGNLRVYIPFLPRKLPTHWPISSAP